MSDANATGNDHSDTTSSLLKVGGNPMSHLECVLGSEEIASFRACLRRNNFFKATHITDNYPNGSRYFYFSNYVSIDPGNHPEGTMMKYVSSNYAGFRGSMRFRSYPLTRFGFNFVGSSSAYQWTPATFRTIVDRSWSPSDLGSVTSSPSGDFRWDEMWSGAQFSTKEMSEVTSIEVPYYSRFRFHSATEDERVLTLRHTVVQQPITPNGNTECGDVFTTSIGSDFMLYFFLGVAPMWISS